MPIRPILIVEDDEPTQNLLRVVLQRFGHTSEIASNGGDAIEMLGQREYSAVILDLMMPNVSGYDVLAFLAASERPVPVIVCTAAGTAGTATLDPKVVKAVLRKPFDIDELATTVAGLTSAQTVSKE